jgi:cytochrome c553
MTRASGIAVAIAALFAGPLLAQDADRGAQIASQACAACHGVDGNSTAPENPKIAGQLAEYLYKQLLDYKPQEGKKPARENPIMNSMVAPLSEADMKSVAAHYAGQALKPAAAADKDLVELGQKLWRGGNRETGVPACAGCHGPAGAGMPSQYPSLAGQFPEYLAAQLTAFRDGVRANDPNGMMRGAVARMTEREIRAVAEYASGLR